MNVRNCNKCGRIFNYVTGQSICSQCKKDLEVLFKETRVFIRRNPNASMQEVSESCKVEIKQIKQWIREERLSFSKDSDVGVECEQCGTKIKTGRFCEPCKASTLKDLNSVRQPQNSAPVESSPKPEVKNQMHFLNKDR
jgi:flagellar operon protein (TIGR03826 family)